MSPFSVGGFLFPIAEGDEGQAAAQAFELHIFLYYQENISMSALKSTNLGSLEQLVGRITNLLSIHVILFTYYYIYKKLRSPVREWKTKINK